MFHLRSFYTPIYTYTGFPGGEVVKNSPANAGDTRDMGSIPGSGRFPWRREWQLTPVFLLGKFHRQRSLEGYSPWSEVAQSCPTLCDPMDSSPPGSTVHGIFQARILEWATISFSRGSSQPRDQTQVSRTTGRRFTICATKEGLRLNTCYISLKSPI